MKILILCLLLIGCTPKRDLEALQEALYESDIIYVDIELNELYELLQINENDYKDHILLKSLVKVDQKIIYIFQEPSIYLKKRFHVIQDNESYIYEHNNCIIYMNHYDSDLMYFINEYLDRIDS